MGTELRVFGPPGCGKTTYTTKQIQNAVDKHGKDSVIVASFTKTAAAELVGRDLPIEREQVGTLHSHCYRALGRPPIAETNIQEWNAYAAEFPLSAGGSISMEESAIDQAFATDADRIFMSYQIMRAKLIPRELWNTEVQAFGKKWDDWKRATNVIDFTDMIELAITETDNAPGAPLVGFFDEVQDFTPLEFKLVRKWAESMEYIVMSGDDDQCQPEGSMVLTTDGYIPIEYLDPKVHRVVSYDRTKSAVTGIRDGYEFKKSVRNYSGTVLDITAGGKTATCTPEHKWLAKWSDRAKQDDVHVVYLMRKGNRFRIGWCKLFRVDGTFHLGVRARLEDADAAWILKVTYDRTEASLWESYLSTEYGLPLITFRPIENSQHYTQETIDSVFEMLGNKLWIRAIECLEHFGLHVAHPIWTKAKAYERRGGASILEIEAMNLISGLFEIPVHVKSTKAEWMPIEIKKCKYEGPVYSLDVEKYHLYITDGLVTHNCIYSFKGSSPEAFLTPLPEENKRVLSQSYRVPRKVQEVAERWVKQLTHREPKEYKPRDEEGEVRDLPEANWRVPERALADAEKYLAAGKSVLFLTTCSFMLEPLKACLRSQGVPFHNPYRRSRGDWNPLTPGSGTSSAERLLAYLRLDQNVWGEEARMWNGTEVKQWGSVLNAKGIFKRGSKAEVERMAGFDELDLDFLFRYFEEDALVQAVNMDLDWFENNLMAAKKKGMEFPLLLARTNPKLLRGKPQIILGTIHSVKGGEADVVYLFPDLSVAGMREWITPGETRDSIIRQFYVGFTRAKESLILCGPGTAYRVKF